jgi:hypothetical protein
MRNFVIRALRIAVIASAAVVFMISPKAWAQSGSGCVGGSGLNGWYGLLVSANGNGGRFLTGAVNFNGACSLSGSNLSGGMGSQVSTSTLTGTYGQNSDGSYNLTLNPANSSSPLTFTIGVSASGTKAVGIESDGSTVSTIDLESQLTNLTNGYSTALLTGAYAVSCTSGSRVGFDYVTFDGNGNLSGVNAYDLGGSQGYSTFSGTYAVNGDGTFSGALSGNYSQYTLTGVIDNGVSEIQYTYNQSGSGEVEACTGRQAPPATLSGYYGLLIGGNATNGQGGQEELSGSAYFNSNGTFSVTNLQGGISAQYGNTTATGTYAPNGDGTLTLNLTPAGQATLTFIVAVSEGGNEAVGIQTDGTAEATIDLQSQLVANGTSYSNASLIGTYAARCWGAEVDLNYVTFDGNGNQGGVDPYDNGNYGVGPYTGTYAVNSDGTFTGGFSGAYAAYTMTGVIDNANSEIEFTYDYTGSSVVSCVGYSSYGPVSASPVAATPTFTPAPGAYGIGQTVTLATSTPGATIYYTTNGVTPTTSSLIYTQPFPVSLTTTVEAIAVAPGYNNSAIGAATYFAGGPPPTAATPSFTPAPGTYNSSQSVTISDGTAGAVIHCTTDGSTPTASSPVCTTVAVSSGNLTLQAIAVETGYNNSAVMTGSYTITPTAATPTFSPSPGTYNLGQNVTISDATAGAVIHCTTDGSTPTTSSPVCTTVAVNSGSLTLQAIAVETGYNNSAVMTGTYTITPTAATPSFTPAPGTYNSSQNVTISDATSGAVIHCTTDGSTPTASSPVCTTVAVNSGSLTLQAIAVETGYNNSAVMTGSYTITPTAATPTFTPAPGTYNSSQNVTISDGTAGAVIHCTTDGSTPTASSPVCTTVAVSSGSLTLQAIAVETGYNNSAVMTGSYTITPTAATPSFTPAPGTYNSSQSVTISDATAGAVIHCTTDGSTPTASSPVCTTVAVNSGSLTLQAIAVETGYNNSAVMTGSYTITPTAATPTFSPAPGTYNSSQNVTISDGTAGAVIHCTTDGSTPTASSPVCTTVAVSSGSLTLQAIAVETGYNNSAVMTGTYTITPTAATPTFSPAPGTYNSSQSVTISDGTAGAVIHCTTDGSTPTVSSPVCTTVAVSSSLTLKAIAAATGYNTSGVATGAYSITPTAAAPAFSAAPGKYSGSVTVTLSDSTPGAVIHCTINGTTPTASSDVCTSVRIAVTETLKAIAIASGYNNSALTTGSYTIALPVAAAPTMNPKPGSYNSNQSVTLSDATPGAVIHYTSDGSTPTATSPVYSKPLQVNRSETIHAIAVARGYGNSPVALGSYTIGAPSGNHRESEEAIPADQR